MAKNSKRKSSIPNPAVKIFEKLIGKWELKGRTLDSKEDNITGWTTFEWTPGGFFLKSEGEINFKGFVMQSLEIIGYDSKKKTSGSGATYRGTISEDGNAITGDGDRMRVRQLRMAPLMMLLWFE